MTSHLLCVSISSCRNLSKYAANHLASAAWVDDPFNLHASSSLCVCVCVCVCECVCVCVNHATYLLLVLHLTNTLTCYQIFLLSHVFQQSRVIQVFKITSSLHFTLKFSKKKLLPVGIKLGTSCDHSDAHAVVLAGRSVKWVLLHAPLYILDLNHF